jgi:hypothetical protein
MDLDHADTLRAEILIKSHRRMLACSSYNADLPNPAPVKLRFHGCKKKATHAGALEAVGHAEVENLRGR